jgi:hypothetical protein
LQRGAAGWSQGAAGARPSLPVSCRIGNAMPGRSTQEVCGRATLAHGRCLGAAVTSVLSIAGQEHYFMGCQLFWAAVSQPLWPALLSMTPERGPLTLAAAVVSRGRERAALCRSPRKGDVLLRGGRRLGHADLLPGGPAEAAARGPRRPEVQCQVPWPGSGQGGLRAHLSRLERHI